jgi:hypothetical protein
VKVEKQISEYQYEIKRLLSEKDESTKALNMQIEGLTVQLQNLESAKKVENEVSAHAK